MKLWDFSHVNDYGYDASLRLVCISNWVLLGIDLNTTVYPSSAISVEFSIFEGSLLTVSVQLFGNYLVVNLLSRGVFTEKDGEWI